MVGAGRAAYAEVDAAGKQRAENTERLGDFQRTIMRQHHAAAPDPQPVGNHADRSDHHFRTGAGQHRSAVMFRHPVALKAEFVGEARQLQRVPQRIGARESFGDRRLIENADFHRGRYLHGIKARVALIALNTRRLYRAATASATDVLESVDGQRPLLYSGSTNPALMGRTHPRHSQGILSRHYSPTSQDGVITPGVSQGILSRYNSPTSQEGHNPWRKPGDSLTFNSASTPSVVPVSPNRGKIFSTL